MSNQQQPLDALSTDHLRADLKGRSIRGGAKTLTAQGARFLLQTISTVVLARLLTPADFGIVAMVTAVTGIASMFADVGLSEAIIQREDVSQDQVSMLFWINAGIGALFTVVAAAAAPGMAWFFGEPRLVDITLCLSLTFLFSGLMVQHDALLKRQMRFSALAVRDVVSYSLGVSAAIGMAAFGAGYWALVALPLTVSLSKMAFSLLMANWRPSWPRRGVEIRSLLVFGSNLMAADFLSYLSRNADNVLVGWYWGAGPLGLYSRAYSLLMFPLGQLNAPIRAVAVPTFSRVQDDPERYARYYLRTVTLILWISAPFMGFLFVAAEPVILLALGHQWRECVGVFQVLAISALAQPILNTTGWLFVSRGRTDRILRLALVMCPVLVGSFVVGLPFGIKGVALAYSLVLMAILPWVFQFTFRGTMLTLQGLGRAVLYPVSLCLVAVTVSLFAVHWLTPRGHLSHLLIVLLGFATTYSFSALLPPVRKEILSFRDLLRELRPSSRSD